MKNPKQSGQTFIEVLVTVLILCFGTIALIRFQNYLAYDNSLAEQRNEALILGSQEIEQLRTYQVLNTTAGYADYSSIASGSGTTTGANTSYSLSWTVTAYTNPTYKAVAVTVSWTDRYGNAQSVNLYSSIPGIDPPNSAIIM